MVTASASVYPRRSKRLLHARVKKPKHKYACHTNPKKKHPIPYGTGFLFTQSDNNTGRCVRTELKTRSITAEELIMNESTFSFVDSNCLQDAFSSRGTTSSSGFVMSSRFMTRMKPENVLTYSGHSVGHHFCLN